MKSSGINLPDEIWAEALAHKIADLFPAPHTDQKIYEMVQPVIFAHLRVQPLHGREVDERANAFALEYDKRAFRPERQEVPFMADWALCFKEGALSERNLIRSRLLAVREKLKSALDYMSANSLVGPAGLNAGMALASLNKLLEEG